MADIWSTSVEVETNPSNWTGAPLLEVGRARVPDNTPLHIDLFSGAGGFSCGFENAGFTTAVAVDHHPPSVKTIRINHPSCVTVCGDIRLVEASILAEVLPSGTNETVLTAGVPCQGFSLSNRKRHADDKRNFLFLEFIRIAKELKPSALVLENVSGLVSTGGGSFKSAIAEAISELGYDVHFTLLNAAEYGVPQHRKRVFFVGLPRGTNFYFPEATHGDGKLPFVTVGDAILGDLPALASNQIETSYSGLPQTKYQKLMRGRTRRLTNHRAPNHPPETIARIAATIPGEPMYPEFKQRIRLHPEKSSPTQICGGIRPQFQFGHPSQPRGLTIRERARLQSFPDSYEFAGGVTQGRVQTGNAVPPILAEVLATQILKALRGELKEMPKPLDEQARLF